MGCLPLEGYTGVQLRAWTNRGLSLLGWSGFSATMRLVFGLKAKLPHRAFCTAQVGGLVPVAERIQLQTQHHSLRVCLASRCWPLNHSKN